MLQLKKFDTLRWEFYRFIIVGIINTIVGLSIIFLALYAGLGNFSSNILGYSCGLISAYFLNKHFVFRVKNSNLNRHELFLFLIVFILSYITNIIVLYALLHFGAHAYVAQTFAMITYSIFNFLLNKFLTFKKVLE